MILLRWLLQSWLRFVCRVRGHKMVALGLYGSARLTLRCTRCDARQRLHWTRHQGQHECARRMNQILRGQLTESNGLVPGERAKLLAAVRVAQRKARESELEIRYED